VIGLSIGDGASGDLNGSERLRGLVPVIALVRSGVVLLMLIRHGVVDPDGFLYNRNGRWEVARILMQ
jgi:hypothetical protein